MSQLIRLPTPAGQASCFLLKTSMPNSDKPGLIVKVESGVPVPAKPYTYRMFAEPSFAERMLPYRPRFIGDGLSSEDAPDGLAKLIETGERVPGPFAPSDRAYFADCPLGD